jgi:hypothetical protein
MKSMGFNNKTKTALEAMLSIEADINRAKEALSLVLSQEDLPGVILAALYTQFLVSYVRSFGTGRRKGLSEDVFGGAADLLTIHRDLKAVRDKHVAHPVSDHEHCAVLAAVPDETKPEAVGLGVRYWFFVSDEPSKLREYQKVLDFVREYLSREIERLGTELAVEVLGPGYTWQTAQDSFWQVLGSEEVLGPGADEHRPPSPH